MTPKLLAYRGVWLPLGSASMAFGTLYYQNTIAFENGPFMGALGALLILSVLLLAPMPRTLIGFCLWVSLKLSVVIAAGFGAWWPAILAISPVLHGTVVMVAALATHFMDEDMLPRWPPAPTATDLVATVER